jgi:hypothetical protein
MNPSDDGAIGLLEISDVSGQKGATVRNLPGDTTVGELIETLLRELDLSHDDPDGRPVTYQARLEREGRHLLASERAGDALQSGDRLVLQPNIDAG